MALKDLLAQMKGEMPAPAAEEEKKPRGRKEWDELDQETGAPLENIPGIEESVGPDDLMGPGEIKAGMGAIKGLPMVAGMLGKGLMRSAESGAVRAGENTLARKSLSEMPMPAPSTRDINKALKGTSPEVAREAGRNLDDLGKRGVERIQDIEARRVEQTLANSKAEIGARDPSQRAKVRSNPKPTEFEIVKGKWIEKKNK